MSDAPRTNVKMLKKLKNNQIKILKMFAIGSLTMDETKFILFANKRKVKSARKLNINFKNIKKTHSQLTYLGCVLDKTLSGEPTALKALNKTNGELRFFYRKNKFLTPALRRKLFNALIQSHYDYACSTWYPNLNEKLKSKKQIAQNKCTRFCLKFDEIHHIFSTSV